MRAAWLEDHDEFEGVGAHELNHRYDAVDDGEHDPEIVAVPAMMPALFAARSALLTEAVVGPVRFGGADISHYQHDQAADVGKAVDWSALFGASHDHWFGFKLSQSTKYVDPTARRSRLAAKASGVRYRLPYHWLSSTTDPEEQAAHYLKALDDIGGPPEEGEIPMLDAEEAGITADMVLAWCEYIEAHTPGRQTPSDVYSGAFVTGGTIWQSTRIRESKFGPRPMILAAYTAEARARALPGVRAYPWSSWQYSSNGPVPGIVGRCDMNRIDDFAAYDLAAGYSSSTSPTSPIEDTPTGPVTTPTSPVTFPTPYPVPTEGVNDMADAKLVHSANGQIALQLIMDDGYTFHGIDAGDQQAVRDIWKVSGEGTVSAALFDDIAGKAKV